MQPATSQGNLKLPEVERSKKKYSSLQPSERVWLGQYFDIGLLAQNHRR